MTAERLHPSGAWLVSAFVRDSLGEWMESRTYYGYTRAESLRLFREHVAGNGWTVTA